MVSGPVTVADAAHSGLLDRFAPSVAVDDGLRASIHQTLVMAAIVAFMWALALAHLGVLARPIYVVAVMMAAVWYYRRSPWLYLTLSLWLWTISPFVRRIIDYSAGFNQFNVVLIAPNLVALLMVRDIVVSRTLFRRPEALVGLMLVTPALYGLIINLVQGEIFPGAVAASDWIAPLLYYFFVIDKAPSVRDAEPYLRWFITLNGLTIVGYGLNQVWNMPAWDIAWARQSGIFGTSELPPSQTFHPFATLNITGLLSVWLGTLILLSLYFRTKLTSILLPATCVLLILTFVRSVTLGVVLGVVIAVLLGGRRMVGGLVRAGILLVFIGIIAAALDPTMTDEVTTRFGSLGALQYDDSALTRAAIWSHAPALIDAHPFGLGIGAIGRGAVSSGDANLVTVDAGPLAIYLALGWVCGSIYLVGIFAVIGLAMVSAARARSLPAIAFVAAAVCTVSELPFVNINGFFGVVIWLCAGFAMAYGIQNRLKLRQGN